MQKRRWNYERSTVLLSVENIETYYGVIRAIKGISFDVKQGEIVSLIGGNGAGKTTTLYTITGILKPKEWAHHFRRSRTSKKTAQKRLSGMGLALVPEGRQVFGKLTVLENLRMGAYTLNDKAEYQAPAG